jgi:dephospho-CoA kinase
MSSATLNSNAMIIGLTGGIGSGKSAATAIFESLGIEVVDADVISRIVVEPGTEALNKIQQHFGPEVIGNNGSLERGKLRELIFADVAEKQWLEALLHPLIRQETERRLSAATSPYVIFCSPLLFETTQASLAERVVLIDAPEGQQLARASLRDGVSPEAVSAIMRSQLSRKERLAKANDIIVNDRDLAHLERSIKKLHEEYIRLATTRDHQ